MALVKEIITVAVKKQKKESKSSIWKGCSCEVAIVPVYHYCMFTSFGRFSISSITCPRQAKRINGSSIARCTVTYAYYCVRLPFFFFIHHFALDVTFYLNMSRETASSSAIWAIFNASEGRSRECLPNQFYTFPFARIPASYVKRVQSKHVHFNCKARGATLIPRRKGKVNSCYQRSDNKELFSGFGVQKTALQWSIETCLQRVKYPIITIVCCFPFFVSYGDILFNKKWTNQHSCLCFLSTREPALATNMHITITYYIYTNVTSC